MEVDVLREEWMGLDLLCSVDTQTLGWVAREEAGEDAPSLDANIVAEN